MDVYKTSKYMTPFFDSDLVNAREIKLLNSN